MTLAAGPPAPQPPADIAARDPEIVVLPLGEKLHRFYTAAYQPIHFDKTRGGRLNSPNGSYGVMYASKEIYGAFAETFLRHPGKTLLELAFVKSKGHVILEATREMQFIKLAGKGLAKLGATAEVVHGGLPYDTPQAWSAALHAHPREVDGIAYNARHDDEQLCYAIFERAASAIIVHTQDTDLDKEPFWLMAERYGIGMIVT